MAEVDKWEASIVLKSLAKDGILPDASPETRQTTLLDVRPAVSYHLISNIRLLRATATLSLIQPHIPSRPIEAWPADPPLPGLLFLLFHPDIKFRAFAASCLSRCNTTPMREDGFEAQYYYILEILSCAITPGSVASTAETEIQLSTDEAVVWEGVHIAIQHIPDAYLQCGRKTSIDLAHAISGRLHDCGPRTSRCIIIGAWAHSFFFFTDFPNVLKCFVYALKRLDGLFWANRGEDYPQVVFASIKDNPSFLDLLRTCDTSESLPWFLLWIPDYAWSVWSLHAFDDLLAKMVDFLSEELQHERFKDSRPMMMHASVKV
jgi:senataxin